MLLAVGGYARDIFGAGTEEYKLVVKASLLSAGLVGIGCYLTGFPLSRGFFLLVFTIGTPLLLGWRFVFRRSIQHTRRHGHLREGVIIAGNPITSTRSPPCCAASRGSATPCSAR